MDTSTLTRRFPIALALAAILISAPGLVFAQYEASRTDEEEEETPTVEGILEAFKAGRPAGDIVTWIEDSGEVFDLDLGEALGLRSQGLPHSVIAAMTEIPEPKLVEIMPAEPGALPAPAQYRKTGLSKHEIGSMIKAGTPEAEILAVISEKGSKATLSLQEAIDLHAKGATPVLLAAIATGVLVQAPTSAATSAAPAAQGAPAPQAQTPAPPQATAQQAPGSTAPAAQGAPAAPPAGSAAAPSAGAAPSGAAPPAAAPSAAAAETEQAPSLDDLLEDQEEGEEKEVVGEEGQTEEEPLLEDVLSEGESIKKLEASALVTVLSRVPGEKVYVVPASIRAPDLLRRARSAGHTPARFKLPSGSYMVLVEKKLDAGDAAFIPAFRTVHDGTGTTRTLIESGDIFYDVNRCCLPLSLTGDLTISRIGENQLRPILGDHFAGLPPYLWDGNRLLLLSIRNGKIVRALKAYDLHKADTESLTLVAGFTPTLADPLVPDPRDPNEPIDRVVLETKALWTPPNPTDLEGVGRIYGIPDPDVIRLISALTNEGKATWKTSSSDGSYLLLTLSLDTLGRTRLSEVRLRHDGPNGTLSTPAPEKKRKSKKSAAPPAPPALPAPSRSVVPELTLPVLSIENTTKSAALIKLSDGTFLFILPGDTREVTMSPGSYELEAKFEDAKMERRIGRAQFASQARYSLKLS